MSHASKATISKSKACPGRYRTIAPNSQVDETLFGNPDKVTSRRNSGAPAKGKTQRNREGETIQIISKDPTRNPRVPSKNPSGGSIPPRAQVEKRTSAYGIRSKQETVEKKKSNQIEKQKKGKAVEERQKLTEKPCKEKPVLTGLQREGRVRAEPAVQRSTARAKVEIQKSKGEKIQIISKDLIRNLRVPSKDPSGGSVILPRALFEKMTSARGIITKEERAAERKVFQVEKLKEIKAAEDRRKMMETSCKKNPELTALEQEASARAQRVVERATALKMEEEDEIKQFKQLIQEAQCLADRDLQIQENKMIREEMAAEERRLDARIEEERRKTEETRDKIDERRKQQNIRGMQQINDQIQQHQLEKKMKNQMKDQERQQLREKEEQMKLEELRALEKKRAEQALLQKEIVRINAEAMRAKEQKKEQKKQEDLRDRKHIQKKMEQEAEHEAEKKRIRKEQNLENAQIWAQQQKAKTKKAEQDELRAEREQENMEREWRRAEKEKATKKFLEDKMLKAGRSDQIHYKDLCMAKEVGRDKTEFKRVMNKTQAAITKDQEQQQRQRQNAQRNTQALQKQMQERKLSTAAKRKELLMEAERQKEEARLKQLRIEELKQKKLKEIKATGVPDKYYKQVIKKSRKVGLA